MRIDSDRWLDLVLEGAFKLGLEVNRQQASLFARHARLLLQWNRKINLTAITEPVQIAAKHFIDAIAPINQIPSKGRLLDIGTGAGFPGIPLKIMRPEQPMTLIDSVRKKVNFVKYTIRDLSLGGIDAVHTRAEALLTLRSYRYRYDVIVSRALADLDTAVRLAAPLLASGGCIILYRGPQNATGKKNGETRLYRVDDLNFLMTTLSYQLPLVDVARRVTVFKPAE